MHVLSALLTVAGLTGLLATLLAVASRWLSVVEDPRIATVYALLPHTNCGACGFPGCQAFAEALVSGAALPSKCSVGSPSDHARVAALLGVEAGQAERRIARLACAGGRNVARQQAHYQGAGSCAAAAIVAGGGKACWWGCIGLADCQQACQFNAIEMSEHHLPVVNEHLCTGCGDCVRVCPKDLFSLHEPSHQLWVACSSLAHGEEVLEQCEVGCTGCGRCEMDAPGLVHLENHLPVVNYACHSQTQRPIQRCPTGAIVWYDPEKGVIKGDATSPVVRRQEIPDRAT